MAQPLARDEQGNIWDISDPTHPKFVSHGASPLASPTLPYEAPQAQTNLQKSQFELEQEKAQATADTQQKQAAAKTAQIQAAQAQEQWNITHPSSTGTEGLSGPAYMHYLQQTDPGRAAYVQGLAEGRVPFPSSNMMRTPAGQALLAQVMRADPTIDATNYTTRAAARVNAAKGTLGQSDNALIAAIGHAARLNGLVPDVMGTPVRPLNSVGNFIEGNILGGKQPAYDQNAELLGDEVAAAYGANSQGKQNEAGAQFSSSLSTKQKNDNILGAIDLMGSKLAANRAQFAYGNGQLGKPDFMLLPPETRQEILSIPGGAQIFAKHFSGVPVMGGGNQPPPGGFPPPPTGPTNGGVSPSTNGFNETPDPQSAAFWTAAARNGVSYKDALAQWQQSVGQRGLVGQTPPPPDAYQKASDYIAKHPNVPYQPFDSITRTPTSPIQRAMDAAAFSGPGVAIGHAANAAAASVPTLLAGDQGARYNAVSNALHPNYAMGGDIAGTIAGALGTTKAVEGIAPFLGGYGRIIGGTPARAALTGDTAFFGGSGAAQNPDHPVLGAIGGMLAGIAGNAAGRYILGPAVAKVADRLGGMFGAKPPAPLDYGQNMIFNRAAPLAAISGNLQDASNLGLPYMLADASPQLRALAGSAVRKNPDVRALAEGIINPRQLGQGERAISQINTNLAPVGDVPSIVADANARAQQAAQPLYELAYGIPGRTNDNLQAILNTPAGRQALNRARTIAANEQRDPNALGFDLNDQGETVLTKVPSVQTLDYVKRGLDDTLEQYRDPITGKLNLDEAGRAINGVRGRFLAEADNLFPQYAAARQAYADVAKQGSAAKSGALANGTRITPEQAQTMAANAGDNLPFFRRGYASDMADQVERQRMTGNPYNLIYGSMGQQAKINGIFPGAQNFARAHGLEGDMSKTAYETLGGSPTATRTEADKAFDNAELASDLATSFATHGASLPGMAMTGLRKLANGGLDSLKYRMSSQKAAQIAPLLFNPDPNASNMMLNNIMSQGAARQAFLQRLGAITGNVGAGMFAAPMIYGGQ